MRFATDRMWTRRFNWKLITSASCVFLIAFLFIGRHVFQDKLYQPPKSPNQPQIGFDWANRKEDYPVTSFATLPRPERTALPRIQAEVFPDESEVERLERERKKDEIKAAMLHCWKGYREHAWLRDEVLPITGGTRAKVGNWGATLVDSLDTLWIMGLKEEYEEAVEAAIGIDFTSTTEDYVSVFETTIRYLGAFIATYDLSGDERLLRKAIEVANTLYAAFDTPNRVPVILLFLKDVVNGAKQIASEETGLASTGTLSLEFTRLTQITGDDKWYSAIASLTDILASSQDSTSLPGMWPTTFDGQTLDMTGPHDLFSLGGSSDSAYEYLIKEYVLLGGSTLYEDMYRKAMDTVMESVLFQPMIPTEENILMAGHSLIDAYEGTRLKPQVDHLSCFAGGMFALGGRALGIDTHIGVGRRLTNGCIYAYNTTTLGVMPEESFWIPCSVGIDCKEASECTWSERNWRDQIVQPDKDPPKGITHIQESKYIMRPEAIESVFLLYRITGDASLQEAAWEMFQRINNATRTEIANAALSNVMDSKASQFDEMESFFLAETLKYFYLVFETPDVLSLDEWVFNTEAHPLRRPN